VSRLQGLADEAADVGSELPGKLARARFPCLTLSRQARVWPDPHSIPARSRAGHGDVSPGVAPGAAPSPCLDPGALATSSSVHGGSTCLRTTRAGAAVGEGPGGLGVTAGAGACRRRCGSRAGAGPGPSPAGPGRPSRLATPGGSSPCGPLASRSASSCAMASSHWLRQALFASFTRSRLAIRSGHRPLPPRQSLGAAPPSPPPGVLRSFPHPSSSRGSPP